MSVPRLTVTLSAVLLLAGCDRCQDCFFGPDFDEIDRAYKYCAYEGSKLPKDQFDNFYRNCTETRVDQVTLRVAMPAPKQW